MALSWWEKGLWQICMHHWTVHAKVEFQKCPWDVSLAEVHSTTFPELRNDPELNDDKGLWQICMHHWTVHAKVEFQKCPWDVSLAGVHSTTLDPELRNEFKSFSNLGSLFHNFWSWTDGDNGLWQICMHHWTVHAKVEFQKCPWDVSLAGVSFHNFGSWTQKLKFTLISWRGFLQYWCIQPFQICIFKRKYSWTFSNELMGTKVYGKFACIIGQYMQK